MIKIDHINTQKKRIYSGVTELYKVPGSAGELVESVDWDEFTRDILESQIAFYQGDFKKNLELASRYYDESETSVPYRIAVGWQYVLSAIYTGNIKLWKQGNSYMAGAVCNSEREKLLLDFWFAAATSAIGDETLFPEQFCRGDLTFLPAETFATASYHYVKYLYLICSKPDIGKSALEILHTLPLIIEPLISKISIEGIIIIEIYLRLLCGLAYHIIGKDELAVPHLDKAIELGMPDKLYTPFGEYRRRFGFLLDDRISINYPEALPAVKKISKSLFEGTTILYNSLFGKNRTINLSAREWQAAKLAVYGLSNKEIADRMGITVNAVKQALRLAMDKTGAESRTDIAKYI